MIPSEATRHLDVGKRMPVDWDAGALGGFNYDACESRLAVHDDITIIYSFSAVSAIVLFSHLLMCTHQNLLWSYGFGYVFWRLSFPSKCDAAALTGLIHLDLFGARITDTGTNCFRCRWTDFCTFYRNTCFHILHFFRERFDILDNSRSMRKIISMLSYFNRTWACSSLLINLH